jgi:phosphatidylserine/phosphatidylglycerophosphate/cardiolipin synthase-like enzyme
MESSLMTGDKGNYEVHFGGPDFPACHLRDLLAERIAAVPPGGEIDWVTYYFRDRMLASELLRAHRRGVKVTLTIEKHPRTAHANEKVATVLSGLNGLGTGYRSLALRKIPISLGKAQRPHLHEKLYCFSHPTPVAFIGSFNPSGDGCNDDLAIINEIGDQDRGYNVLDPALVKQMVEHARWIHTARFFLLHRFSGRAHKVIKGRDIEIHFWPRVKPHPILQFLYQLGADARIRIAASHLKGTSVVNGILKLASRGAHVEILAEPTLRRVPKQVEQKLTQAGIPFRRVNHPAGLPMHNKFVLAEKDSKQWVMFGSFSWTDRSYRLNYEIGAISSNQQLFDMFAKRWDDLAVCED